MFNHIFFSVTSGCFMHFSCRPKIFQIKLAYTIFLYRTLQRRMVKLSFILFIYLLSHESKRFSLQSLLVFFFRVEDKIFVKSRINRSSEKACLTIFDIFYVSRRLNFCLSTKRTIKFCLVYNITSIIISKNRKKKTALLTDLLYVPV